MPPRRTGITLLLAAATLALSPTALGASTHQHNPEQGTTAVSVLIPQHIPRSAPPAEEARSIIATTLLLGQHHLLTSLLLPELGTAAGLAPLRAPVRVDQTLRDWRPASAARAEALLLARRQQPAEALSLLLQHAPGEEDTHWCTTLETVLSLDSNEAPAPVHAARTLWCEDGLPQVDTIPEHLLRQAANHVFRTRHRDTALPFLGAISDRLEPRSQQWCEVRLDEAITLARQRERDQALALHQQLSEDCEAFPHVHVRTLYARMTRSGDREMARIADRILELYPERTHADDAMYFAALADSSRRVDAARTAHERWPDGDLVGRIQLLALGELEAPADVQLLNALIHGPWRDPAYETAGRLEFEAARRSLPDIQAACGYIGLLTERYPWTWTAEVAMRDERFTECPRSPALAPGDTLVVQVRDPERARATERLVRVGAWRAAAEIWESVEDPTSDERWLAAALHYRAGDARQAHLPTRWMLYGWEREVGLDDPRWRIAWPTPWLDEVREAARATEVSPSLILAVMREESAFRETVRSFAGATGLMQVMPATAAENMDGLAPDEDWSVPAANIRTGANVLAGLQSRWPEDIMRIAVGYNAGPGRVRQWNTRFGDVEPVDWMDAIPFPEAWHYSRRVMQSERIYRMLLTP